MRPLRAGNQQGLHVRASRHLRVRWVKALVQFSLQDQRTRNNKGVFQSRGLAQRNPVLPDVPTSAEVGFAALQGDAWFGLMAPAGTPRAIVDWLNAETRKAFEVPEVRERLSKQGYNCRSEARKSSPR